MTEYLLDFLIAFPLIGTLVLASIPANRERLIRSLSVGWMVVLFGASLALLNTDYTQAGFHFIHRVPLFADFGISWNLGIDGISLWLVLLTTLLSPVALYASWGSIHSRMKHYAVAFLVLEAGMIGAFVALDLFLFYVFWELMLIPMYFIIGIWGGKRRVYAAIKFFIYTALASLLMLAALLYVVVQYKAVAGHYSFDFEDLTRLVLPYGTQFWLFLAFALAFAVKVPMFPVHTWLPDAHVEAPTGGSVILAAVMLKLGAYGFVRFAMPLFPYASHFIVPTLSVLAVVGIVYGALCAWAQSDFKKLVAYSSVSHLGFVMLGVFSMTNHGVSGAVLQMVNHGISTGALFILVGCVYERRHTRDLDAFGGLAKVMPLYAVALVIVSMSSVGLPGTNGFIGEFMVVAGAFFSQSLPVGQVFAAIAATGVILAAIYMLHAVLKVLWGPITHEANRNLPDMNRRELVSIAPLFVLVFWIGLAPNMFLKPMAPAVDRFVLRYQAKLLQSNRDDALRLLPVPQLDVPVVVGEVTR